MHPTIGIRYTHTHVSHVCLSTPFKNVSESDFTTKETLQYSPTERWKRFHHFNHLPFLSILPIGFYSFCGVRQTPFRRDTLAVTEKKSKAISATVGKGRISRRNSIGIIDINYCKCIYIYTIHNIYREIMNHGYVVYRISFIRHG